MSNESLDVIECFCRGGAVFLFACGVLLVLSLLFRRKPEPQGNRIPPRGGSGTAPPRQRRFLCPKCGHPDCRFSFIASEHIVGETVAPRRTEQEWTR